MSIETEGHSETTLVDRLATMVATHADSTVVYGDPIERGGITIIPVARVKLGFGGGYGHPRRDDAGGGGGGGVNVTPLGYIEIKNGQAQYHPIESPLDIAKTVAIGVIAGILILRPLFRRR